MPPSLDQIATQLEAVAERLIDRVFMTIYGYGPIEAQELYDLVKQVDQVAWEADPTRALRAAITKAANKLPNEPVREEAELTWQRAATTLFNLEQLDLDHLQGHKYKNLVKLMFMADNVMKYSSADVRKEITAEVRKRIAKQLILMQKQQDSDVIEQPQREKAKTSDTYITRKTLERELLTAVTNRGVSGLILLYGAGGMGKSRLVHEFVRNSDRIMLDVSHPRRFDDAILDAVDDRLGKGALEGSPVRRLRKLLESSKAPRYLVLNNIEQEAQLRELLPGQLERTVVIGTARRNLLPTDRGIAIKVGPMQPDEARALLLQRHPSLTREELESLNAVLDGHALGLKQAVAYLRKYAVPVDQFCQALQRHTTKMVADLPVEPPDATLLAICTQVLDRLADRPSLQMLRAMVVLDRSASECSLAAFVSSQSGISPEYPGVAAAQVQEAFEELLDLCLIEYEAFEDDEFTAIDRDVQMHPLTHAILRDLISTDTEAILNGVIESSDSVVSCIRTLHEKWHTTVDRLTEDRSGGSSATVHPFGQWSKRCYGCLSSFASLLSWSITIQEIKLRRAERFPTPEYREAFRRELQRVFCDALLNNLEAEPPLKGYVDWFKNWSRDKPEPYTAVERFIMPAATMHEHEFFQVASQAAIDHFIPVVPNPNSPLK